MIRISIFASIRCGQVLRLLVLGLCGLFLTGCGADFIVLEPVVAEADAIEMPGLEGEYDLFELGEPLPPEELNVILKIYRTAGNDAATAPYYSVEIITESPGEQAEGHPVTGRMLLAPLGNALFLAQFPVPDDQIENIRMMAEDPRLVADRYYALYLLKLSETGEKERFLYVMGVSDEGYRRLSALAQSHGAEIVDRSSGEGSRAHFVLGTPRAVMNTVSGSAGLRLSRGIEFRKRDVQ